MKGLVWIDNENVHSWSNDVVEGTPNLVLYIVFSFEVPLIAHFIARQSLYCLVQSLRDSHYTVLVFDGMMCYKLGLI